MTLEAASGAEVSFRLRLEKTPESTAGQWDPNSLQELDITVYNRTRDEKVENIFVQGTHMILIDGTDAGDELEFTISDTQGRFAPVTASAALDTERKAEVSAVLTEYGIIRGTFGTTKNETVRMLVYDAGGRLADSVSAAGASGSIASGPLADGEYTVVLMGGSSFFDYPNSLNGLALADLAEGTDYVRQAVRVTAGHAAECSFQQIPLLVENRLYYTDPDATAFTASRTTITAGRFFTLRASAQFAGNYQGKVSDVRWVIELPEGTEYYPGTLTVGKQTAAYEQEDDLLTIPVEDPSQILRLCVLATGSGEVRPAAYLQFVYEGKTIRQPVGSVKIRIDGLDFEVTEKTFEPSVTVVGTGAANAEILLYDNDVLVGQTQPSASGSWKLTFDLYKPGTCSTHKLYAQMKLVTGTKVRSAVHTVSYQYAPDPVTVSTVSMYYGSASTPTSVIDFRNHTVSRSSYSVASSKTITFVTKFDCDDVSQLSDVILEVTQDDGTTRTMETIYDEAAGGFVTSGLFTMHAMPVNVAVSYRCNGELIFAEEDYAEVKQDAAEAEELLETLRAEDWTDADLTEMVIDYDGDVPVPESLKTAVAERNAALNKYLKLKQQLEEAKKEASQAIQTSGNKTTLHSADVNAEIEKTELSDFTVADKIAEGYSVFRVGSDPDSLIFYRISVDTETGEIRQSIIDAAGNVQNAAECVYNALAKSVLSGSLTTQIIDGYLSQSQQIPQDLDTGLVLKGGVSVDVYLPDSPTSQELGSFTDLMNDIGTIQTELLGAGELFCNEDLKALIEQDNFKDYLKKSWDNDYLKYEHLVDTDPAKAQQMEKYLNDELKRIEKMGSDLSEAYKVNAKAWKVFDAAGKVVGPPMDIFSIVSDSTTFKTMSDIYEKTGDPEAQLVMGMLACSIFLSGVSLASAFVSGGISLLVMGMISAGVSYFYGQQIDEIADRVKMRYSGTGNPLKPAVDPSGFVYEAVLSNRLPDVTVTCYEQETKLDIYDEPYTEAAVWDATEYEQVNPQLTDEAGQYAWDVPQGIWQVKAELDSYETAYSDWLTVPPPQLEVNLGMVSYAAPGITDVFARPDAVEITFSKYMKAETLTTENITVLANGKSVTGTIELVNAEASAENASQILASKVRFIPEQPLAEGDAVIVSASSQALSYAGVPMQADNRFEAAVVVIPDALLVPESVRLIYGGNGTVSIHAQPEKLAAGLTVQISTESELFVKVEESAVTLDDTGSAVIHVAGKLPGETAILFSMCDGRVQGRTTVVTLMPEKTADLTSLTLAQEYVALEKGHTAALDADVEPQKLRSALCWSVEEGGERIVMVDASGEITALTPGTAYVLATVTDGETTLTARCRVDVTEKPANMEVESVQLGTTAVTTELYRRDYTCFDVILQLPQNQTQNQAKTMLSALSAQANNGVAITEARFENADASMWFDLVVKDDRTLSVVPKQTAIDNPGKVKGSYTSKVVVTVCGEEYTTTGSLKLTVKKSTPKLKVSTLTFNTFYTGQSQAIQITGATVTDISRNTAKDIPNKSSAVPSWLDLSETGGILTLNDTTAKSSNVYVKVDMAEWAIPSYVTVPVKATYAARKLKLSASSVTLSSVNSQGINLKLLCVNKTDTLEKLNVDDVSVDGFDVSFDRVTGELMLTPNAAFNTKPKSVVVSFTDTKRTVSLPLRVAVKTPVLSVKPSSVTLNSTAGDSVRIAVTASPADYGIRVPECFLADKSGKRLEDQTQVAFAYKDGILTVSTNENTLPNTTYYLRIRTQDTKDAVITVKTLAAKNSNITASVKVSGAIDLPFPESTVSVKPAFRNYTSGGFTVESWSIAEYVGKNQVGDAKDLFDLPLENGQILLRAAEPGLDIKHTYYLHATLKLDNGTELNMPTVKIPIKHTSVRLKLSKTSLSLNPTVADYADLTVTCLTKGYDFQKPVVTLVTPAISDGGDINLSGPNPGKPLDFSWSDGVLTVSTNQSTSYGITYKVQIQAAQGEPAVTLAVKTPAANKSSITAKLSVKGSIDVVRDTTSILVTPTFSNCAAPTQTSPVLAIESFPNVKNPAYSDVTDLFTVKENENGTYTITKAPGAELDLSLKSRAKLTFDGGFATSPNLSIKSGTAKAAVTGTPVLYKTDRYSRGTFQISTMDKTLSPIDRLAIKDAKQAALFEIYTYGNGEFAIGFKDNAVKEKTKYPTSVALNVFHEGNTTNTPNAVVTLKLSIR